MKRKAPRHLPFLDGVYVAVDAIPGSFLVVDGPRRVFNKAQTQYRHNIRCRLIPPLGRPAVVHTAARTGMEEDLFRRVCSFPEAEVVFAAGFSARERKASSKLVCPIKPASLGGSWLDGYGLTLEALSRGIPLSRGRARRDSVGIVGYLFDRDEIDHAGNLRELRRLLAGLGVKLASVWLSGSGIRRLREIEAASTILSFPYGRAAARILGRRLGAKVTSVDLPLGLTGTETFVRRVAAALGREDAARRLLDREAASAVEDTEIHVGRVISGRRARLTLPDPHLRASLAVLCEDLGVKVIDGPRERPAEGRPELPHGAGSKRGRQALLVGPRRPGSGDGVVIPFGYPDYEDHPVVERPFLGFTGFRSLVETFAERILRSEAVGDRPAAEASR